MADTKAVVIPIEAKDKTKKGLDDSKKSVEGFFKGLKKGLGEESAFGNAFKALQGAGALAGLALAGRQLNVMADKATELNKGFRDGSKSAGEVGEELAKSLPIYGEIIDAGRKFRAIMDDTATGVARITNETKAVGAALDAQRAIAGERKKNTEDYLATLRQINVEITKLQLKEPDRTVYGIGAQTQDELTAQAKAKAEKRAGIQAIYDKAYKEAQDAIASTPDPKYDHKFNRAGIESDEGRVARLAAQAARKQQQQAQQAAAQARDDALRKLESEDAATRSALTSRGGFRAGDARAGFDAQANAARKDQAANAAKELTDAYRDARQAELRAAGNDLEADLDEASGKLADRLKQIKEDATKSSALFSPADTENQQRIARQAAEQEELARRQQRREADAAKLADIERNNALLRPAVKGVVDSAFKGFDAFTDVFKKNPADAVRDTKLFRTLFPWSYNPDTSDPKTTPFTTATAREARFLTGAGAADQLGREQLAEAKRTNQLLAQIANRPSTAPVPIFPN